MGPDENNLGGRGESQEKDGQRGEGKGAGGASWRNRMRRGEGMVWYPSLP